MIVINVCGDNANNDSSGAEFPYFYQVARLRTLSPSVSLLLRQNDLILDITPKLHCPSSTNCPLYYILASLSPVSSTVLSQINNCPHSHSQLVINIVPALRFMVVINCPYLVGHGSVMLRKSQLG